MIKYFRKKLISFVASFINEEEMLRMCSEVFKPKQQSDMQTIKKEVFTDISKIDQIDEYLEDMMYNDMNRHFSAENPQTQLKARGSYQRTAYFKSNIMKARKGWKDQKEMNIPSYLSN